MKRTVWAIGWLLVTAAATAQGLLALDAVEIIVYSFEGSPEGWEIPDWAKASDDYVGREVVVSGDVATDGASSLKLETTFPADRWTGGYVERQLEVTDWSPFGRLSVGVYLPPQAPEGLTGRLILTIGEQWEWVEMNRAAPLQPGAWTSIAVNLKPGSMDWKFFPDERFRKDVRKLGVRIESNHASAYSGPVYIDRVCLAE